MYAKHNHTREKIHSSSEIRTRVSSNRAAEGLLSSPGYVNWLNIFYTEQKSQVVVTNVMRGNKTMMS